MLTLSVSIAESSICCEVVTSCNKPLTQLTSLIVLFFTQLQDVNQRLQTHLLEIRTLKDVIKTKQEDNQELRDLCCFLDDDRQKYKKLSKEWQRFGRYTSSVIKNEVASHQTKFKDLSTELDSLVRIPITCSFRCTFMRICVPDRYNAEFYYYILYCTFYDLNLNSNYVCLILVF